MKEKTFEELLEINCFSESNEERQKAAKLLEYRYSCEIHCADMDKSVRFAHHARCCTIVAAKICKDVVIYQNVTIGSNMRYNKLDEQWENVGSPILADNVIVADGAKILGPVTIFENTVVAAGAIITKDIPANSVAYGVNEYRPKDKNYDLVFHKNMISGEEIMEVNKARVAEFARVQGVGK